MQTTTKYTEVLRGQNPNPTKGAQGINNQDTAFGSMEEKRTLIKYELTAIFKWAYDELGLLIDLN